MRAKASATLGELATRMAQLEHHNSALAAQVASVEADRSVLQQQVRIGVGFQGLSPSICSCICPPAA